MTPALMVAGPVTQARATARRLRKAAKRVRAHAGVVALRCRNRLVAESVTGTADVVVSMTTHGARLQTVDIALESIARGSVRPRRLILWLDDPALMVRLTPQLRRLQQRGLEVRLTSNYGPHTKYYPYVLSTEEFECPLATADDDIVYPAGWLAALVASHRDHPDTVGGHWVSVVGVDSGSITGYSGWARRHDTEAGIDNFALGVSGVIYPPLMLAALRRGGDAFLDLCPGADDIWLHWTALRAGIRTRQVSAVPRHFPMIPGSQSTALRLNNVGNDRNDHWIRGLYSDSDVLALSSPGTAATLKDGESNAF
ncbi:hypothetical protein [Arthrobacter sp. ZBG10]|uniref:hypothetical protein n=1 Tax=Arthrobacter sp. ZBG10 TaxID=1676590 RepID=UPI0006801D46|nr:hypothetical protein [Arthrobacter sp. ZBG10]